MAQFSVKIIRLNGAVLDENQQPLLARWDHDRFPLTVYFTGPSSDDQTRLARTRARGWREVALPGLPSAVAADAIDILIDLSGHTAGGALAHFARRMAPVQVTWLGYPGSTGVPNVDWLIGDPIVTPAEADGLCSERVMRLPDTVFCFAPEADHPLPDFAAAAHGRPLTFGSFNNVPKLTPSTLSLWSAALAAVPDARLVLRAPSFQDAAAVARFRDLFVEAGTDPARLIFRGPVGLDAMMQAYAGWVVDNEAAFVSRARAAAADRQALIALKQGLRARLIARPAWNPDRFAASFHKALRDIWKQTMARP
jgi:predicted O-linked N-acetylglucosamine transferase (SPINDLY family)